MNKKSAAVMAKTNIPKADYSVSNMGAQFLKDLFHTKYIHMCLKQAHHGNKAPSATVLSMNGNTKQLLLDLQKTSRPLVINFGSVT